MLSLNMKQNKSNTQYPPSSTDTRPILKLKQKQEKQFMSKQKAYGIVLIDGSICLYDTSIQILTYDSSSQTLTLKSQNVPELPTRTYVTGEDAESIKELLGSFLQKESLKNGSKNDILSVPTIKEALTIDDFKTAKEYLKKADVTLLDLSND